MSVAPPCLRDVRAPLVIGVTGHRDLRPEDVPKLESKVREVLHGLQKQFPSTPLILLSPLAEGADRLAARVALECHVQLVVPLPMAQHLYEQDFDSPDSLADFHGLLKQAQHSFVVPARANETEDPRQISARDHRYEVMGKYLAHESQILLALWDGTSSDKIGGTAEIIKFQLQGVQRQSDYDLQPPELFPVYHIVTPRQSDATPLEKPFHLFKKYPTSFRGKKAAEQYYDKIFGNLDDFNQCILNAKQSLIEQATRSKSAAVCGFDDANLSPSETLDLDRYAMSDALARRFQREVLWTHIGLHWLVFAAFVCFVLFAHLPNHSTWLLVGSFVLLGIADLIYKRSTHTKLDVKNQDYRAMAEGCRVRFFWRLAGVHESVADNYLGKQRTELDWIRNGLRAWKLQTPMSPQPGPLAPRDWLSKVQQLWIGEQIKYFQHAITRNEEKLEHIEILMRICLRIFIVIAVCLLAAVIVVRFLDPGSLSHDEHLWMDALIVGLDCFLVAGALLHHAIQQRAYAQHIKQFRRTQAVYQGAQKLVDRKLQENDLAGARECLCKLGQEALSENGDWVLLHRERPLELPPP
jgi:hypothetical protein